MWPRADTRLESLRRFVHRETVLLGALIAIAVAAFGVTQLAAQKSRDLRLRDAAAWHERALREMEAGRADEAVTAFRRAAVIDADNHRYQLDLAQALAADGQDERARQVLVRLRDRQPDDPQANLALARLDSRASNAAAAVRYYDHALAALWGDADVDDRQRVRLELIEFLLQHNQPRRALAELLVVTPTLPDDPALRTRVGRLLLEAGDARRALDQFAAALRLNPDDNPALTGAGEAAFELEDYARARSYLARAANVSGRLADIKTLAELVLTRDPLAPRIGSAARRARLLANVDDVAERLETCSDPGLSSERAAELESIRAELLELHRLLVPGARPVPRDVAEEGLALLVVVEGRLDSCGTRRPIDNALPLIARRHDIG